MGEQSSEEAVQEGERYGYSFLTDTWYRVTEWVELGHGQIGARSKEEVDRETVPNDVLAVTEERGSDV